MLSKRLRFLADFIASDKIVADVGCDHGLLLRFLSDNNKLKKGYAMDVAIGPLNQAIANCKDYKNIQCILSDGLDKLPNDCEIVVIAGMGYLTIKKILKDNLSKLSSLDEVIIQCNTKVDKLREFLNVLGSTIIDEVWVNDVKDYQFIKLSFKEKTYYNQSQQYFGPIFLKKQPINWLRFHRNNLNRLIEINAQKYDEKRNQQIKMIKKTLDNLV